MRIYFPILSTDLNKFVQNEFDKLMIIIIKESSTNDKS